MPPVFKVLRLHIPVFKVLRLHSRCLCVSTGTTHFRIGDRDKSFYFYTTLAKYTCMRIFKALAVSLDLRLFEHLRKGYVQPEHFTNKLHANRIAEVYRKVASQVKGGRRCRKARGYLADLSAPVALTRQSLQHLESMPAQIVTSSEPASLIARSCKCNPVRLSSSLAAALETGITKLPSCSNIYDIVKDSGRMLTVRYNGCVRVRAIVLPLWCIHVMCDSASFSSKNVFCTRSGIYDFKLVTRYRRPYESSNGK